MLQHTRSLLLGLSFVAAMAASTSAAEPFWRGPPDPVVGFGVACENECVATTRDGEHLLCVAGEQWHSCSASWVDTSTRALRWNELVVPVWRNSEARAPAIDAVNRRAKQLAMVPIDPTRVLTFEDVTRATVPASGRLGSIEVTVDSARVNLWMDGKRVDAAPWQPAEWPLSKECSSEGCDLESATIRLYGVGSANKIARVVMAVTYPRTTLSPSVPRWFVLYAGRDGSRDATPPLYDALAHLGLAGDVSVVTWLARATLSPPGVVVTVPAALMAASRPIPPPLWLGLSEPATALAPLPSGVAPDAWVLAVARRKKSADFQWIAVTPQGAAAGSSFSFARSYDELVCPTPFGAGFVCGSTFDCNDLVLVELGKLTPIAQPDEGVWRRLPGEESDVSLSQCDVLATPKGELWVARWSEVKEPWDEENWRAAKVIPAGPPAWRTTSKGARRKWYEEDSARRRLGENPSAGPSGATLRFLLNPYAVPPVKDGLECQREAQITRWFGEPTTRGGPARVTWLSAAPPIYAVTTRDDATYLARACEPMWHVEGTVEDGPGDTWLWTGSEGTRVYRGDHLVARLRPGTSGQFASPMD